MSTATILTPAWNNPGQPFRHSWEGLGNIDQFRWFVRTDCQEHIALAQEELGLRHVRAVGMFDDELRTWSVPPTAWKDKEKTHSANWQIVDECIRRLLDRGVNPMFTTSFCPSQMASGPTTVFTTKARTSPPKDDASWTALVSDGVRHAIRMWGIDVVRSWYFEVWNEPNLGGKDVSSGFFGGDQKDFFHLWDLTWRAIKSVDSQLRVGGPSAARAEWVAELLEHSRKAGTEPDYIITHCYNNDSESQPLSPFAGPQEDRINKSPNFFNGVVRGTRSLLDSLGFRGEVHWNEWGRSWFPADPPRETALEAAFAVRSMAAVSQDATYFAYWCLSDIYDQVGYGANAFHGNYGMLNLNGLRKPAWQAHRLLRRLGTTRIPVTGGDTFTDAIATTDGGRKILAYSHPRSFEDAVAPGTVSIRLDSEPKHPRLYRIDSRDNNIITAWQNLGSPAYLDRNTLADLKNANGLQTSPGAVAITRDATGWLATFALENPGVALLEVD